jgi:hypothetical protein
MRINAMFFAEKYPKICAEYFPRVHKGRMPRFSNLFWDEKFRDKHNLFLGEIDGMNEMFFPSLSGRNV